jgi:hypothetical protein
VRLVSSTVLSNAAAIIGMAGRYMYAVSGLTKLFTIVSMSRNDYVLT